MRKVQLIGTAVGLIPIDISVNEFRVPYTQAIHVRWRTKVSEYMIQQQSYYGCK